MLSLRMSLPCYEIRPRMDENLGLAIVCRNLESKPMGVGVLRVAAPFAVLRCKGPHVQHP